MADPYGRMTMSEVDESPLRDVLLGGWCWSCGGSTDAGRTTCGESGYCVGKGRVETARG